MLPGLLPELLTMLGIVGRVKGIVNSDDDDQGPAEGHQKAVGIQGVRIMRFTPGKGVVASHDGGQVEQLMVRKSGECAHLIVFKEQSSAVG